MRKATKPRFDAWKFVSLTSFNHIFQFIGAFTCFILIGSVGSHFPPTYAALISCVLCSIISLLLLFSNVFGMTRVEEQEWTFWSTIYNISFSFIFLVDSITMLYSSLRWGHMSWWISMILLALITITFIINSVHIVKKQRIIESNIRR